MAFSWIPGEWKPSVFFFFRKFFSTAWGRMNPAIGTVEKFDLSQEFIGIILLPIIGNAAEHYTAITVAMRNKMDLALGAGTRAGNFFWVKFRVGGVSEGTWRIIPFSKW